MYIFTNAVHNIWRNKGKSLLFALIVLSIISISTVGLLIREASGELSADYRSQYGSKVSLSPDFDKVGPGKNSSEGPPTPEQVLNFGQSSLLQKSVYTAHIPVKPNNLKMVDQDADMGHGQSFIQGSGDADGMQASSDFIMPTGKIVGYNSPTISEDFVSGKRQIREGKAYSDNNDCLISVDVAKLNGLKVGDQITVNGMEKNSQPATLRIAGLYADATKNDQSMPFKDAFSNRRNEILTSQKTALKLSIFKGGGTLDADYYLKNPDLLEDFRKEVVKKGLPSTYKITTDEAAYRKATAPLESLRSITSIFLILVILLGAIVLLLLSIMAMRSRRYEIGVLRAIGMKKSKVCIGMVAEVVFVIACCLPIGLGIGESVTQPVANNMLSSQVSSYEAKEKERQKQPGDGGMVIVGPNASEAANIEQPKIEPHLDAKVAGQVVGVSLGIAVLSSLVSVAATTRWEPRRILSEGN